MSVWKAQLLGKHRLVPILNAAYRGLGFWFGILCAWIKTPFFFSTAVL